MMNDKNRKNIIIGASIIFLILIVLLIYYCFYSKKTVDNDLSIDNLETTFTKSNSLEKEIEILEQIIETHRCKINEAQEKLESQNVENQNKINEIKKKLRKNQEKKYNKITDITSNVSMDENQKILQTKIINLYYDAKYNVKQKALEKQVQENQKIKSELEKLLLNEEYLLISLSFNLKSKIIDLLTQQITNLQKKNIENSLEMQKRLIMDANLYSSNLIALNYQKKLETKVSDFIEKEDEFLEANNNFQIQSKYYSKCLDNFNILKHKYKDAQQKPSLFNDETFTSMESLCRNIHDTLNCSIIERQTGTNIFVNEEHSSEEEN